MKSDELHNLQQAERLERVHALINESKEDGMVGPYYITVPESWASFLDQDYFPEIWPNLTLQQRILMIPGIGSLEVKLEEPKTGTTIEIEG